MRRLKLIFVRIKFFTQIVKIFKKIGKEDKRERVREKELKKPIF